MTKGNCIRFIGSSLIPNRSSHILILGNEVNMFIIWFFSQNLIRIALIIIIIIISKFIAFVRN